MSSWNVHTDYADFSKGARFYVMEMMYAPGTTRPPYAVGDLFQVSGAISAVAGTITAVDQSSFDVDLGGTKLRLVPTPPNYSPPSLNTNGIPYDDRLGTPIP